MSSNHLAAHIGLLVMLAPAAAMASPNTLEAAYRKEYAFLAAQKRALKRRLEQLEVAGRAKAKTAEKALLALQKKVLALKAEGDGLDQKLGRDTGGEQRGDLDRVTGVLDRARATVGAWGVKLQSAPKSEGARIALLRKAFGAGVERIGHLGAVGRRQGKFFLEDGTQVSGALIQVGGVATYGLSEEGSGALAPAGAGRLRLWPQDAASSARVLARGEKTGEVGIFLYEGLQKEVRVKEEKSLVATVEAGGLIAWVIVGLGGLALLLLLARGMLLVRAGYRAESLVKGVESLVAEGEEQQALALCERRKGVVAAVLSAALRNLGRDRQQLEDAVSEAGLSRLPLIQRFGAFLTVVAAVAPLLGLLGTVTGMIATFDVITEHGTGDPRLLSGGIAEALITTELGLIVAIPTLLFAALLSNRQRALETLMEQGAVAVLTARDRLAFVAEPERDPEPRRSVTIEGELAAEASL